MQALSPRAKIWALVFGCCFFRFCFLPDLSPGKLGLRRAWRGLQLKAARARPNARFFRHITWPDMVLTEMVPVPDIDFQNVLVSLVRTTFASLHEALPPGYHYLRVTAGVGGSTIGRRGGRWRWLRRPSVPSDPGGRPCSAV